ncbi:MAG: ATP-grasp domain-containing protein [Ancrocorticia sp.]
MRASTQYWSRGFSPEVVRGFPNTNALTSICIVLEAWRRGLRVTFTASSLHTFTVSDGEKTIDFNCCRPDSLTAREDWLRLVRKWDTNQTLSAQGFPVPRAAQLKTAVVTEAELRAHAEDLGYPLVLKPNGGSGGKNVLVNLRTWEELKAAYNHLATVENIRLVQMETYHEGDDYRVLVVGDRVAAACHRVPANVTGDGVQSIRELIDAKNRVRRTNPHLSNGLITVDERALSYLKEQGITSLDTVLPKGELVYIGQVANAMSGGDVIDVTDSLPDLLKETVVQAVGAMPNIYVAGVDILYKEGNDPSDFTIIEMNSRPEITVNMYPVVGVGPDVPKAFIDYFFPNQPRDIAARDNMLRFDSMAIQEFLEMGIADSVSLKPIPDHRFRYRRLVSLGPSANANRLSSRQVAFIKRDANSNDVAGQLRVRDGQLQLIVGAGSRASAQKFVEGVTKRLGVTIGEERKWVGVLPVGFDIPATLIRSTKQ